MTPVEPRADRLPIVGVMGSGSEAHDSKARPLGRWLAQAGVHLLTGGGGGVMSSVSRAFYETEDRRGVVIGILPHGAPGGYPNRWVEIPIATHLPLSGERGTEPMSRNHVNVLSSDAIVALPGSAGTSSEVRLAITYGRPVVAFLDSAAQIPGLPDSVPICSSLEGVRSFVEAHLGGDRRGE